MYYDYEISKHTLNYYLFQGIVVSFGVCIAACLIYKFQLNDIEISIAKTENLIRDSNAREMPIKIMKSK